MESQQEKEILVYKFTNNYNKTYLDEVRSN